MRTGLVSIIVLMDTKASHGGTMSIGRRVGRRDRADEAEAIA